MSAATLHRIHSTLRAALNGAVRAGLIAAHPRWHLAARGHPAAARQQPASRRLLIIMVVP